MTDSGQRRTAACVAAWAAAMLPPVILLGALAAWFVHVPFYEQWWMVPLLAADREGSLDWGLLWQQMGDHRIVLPRLVMILMARLTGWNLWAEALLSVAFAAGALAVLCLMARPALRGPGVWLAPVLSLMVFSLSQWENWLWTLQLMFFMTLLLSVGAVALVSREALQWWHVALAAAAAAGATASFSMGLAAWPAALVAILAGGLSRRRAAMAAVWCAAAAVAAVAYKWGLKFSPVEPIASTAMGRPLGVVRYALVYLGAPITPLGWHGASAAAGALMVAAGAIAIASCFRRGDAHRGLVAASAGLMTFALCGALMTAIGRVDQGIGQAMSPRYVTFSHGLPAGLLLLAGYGLAHAHTRQTRAALATALAAGAVLLAAASWRGVEGMKWRHDYLAPARDELFRLEDDQLLRRLYLVPAQLRDEFVPEARRHGLSLFAG